MIQASRAGRIQLLPTPDYDRFRRGEAQYDIDQDPVWHYQAKAQPFDAVAFYQCDHLGTPQELTDMNGEIAWAAEYKAWGYAYDALSKAGRQAGLKQPLRFQGQYYDHETGLHYNRHRYYDPHSGRFVSKDPIGLVGGWNLHGYVRNPIQRTDPVGLSENYMCENAGLPAWCAPEPNGPNILDQVNPFGVRTDNEKDYTGYFNKRFPKTMLGAKERYHQKILGTVCTSNTFPQKLSGFKYPNNIPITKTDMSQFGDIPQTWKEANVDIGRFEINTDDVTISGNRSSFNYHSNMFVWENTGDNGKWTLGMTRERRVRMGNWTLSGTGSCNVAK